MTILGLKKRLGSHFWNEPYSGSPKIFPGNPSIELSDCGKLADSGFWYWLRIPRVSLHHSCFASLIVAAPGVIISAAPIGALFYPHQRPLQQIRGFGLAIHGCSLMVQADA